MIHRFDRTGKIVQIPTQIMDMLNHVESINRNGSGSDFYLTGSRFFGNVKPSSDWDFFTKYDYNVVSILLNYFGFKDTTTYYGSDDGNSAIVLFSGEYDVHVQFVRNIKLKIDTASAVSDFYAKYTGFMEAVFSNKNDAKSFWNKATMLIHKYSFRCLKISDDLKISDFSDLYRKYSDGEFDKMVARNDVGKPTDYNQRAAQSKFETATVKALYTRIDQLSKDFNAQYDANESLKKENESLKRSNKRLVESVEMNLSTIANYKKIVDDKSAIIARYAKLVEDLNKDRAGDKYAGMVAGRIPVKEWHPAIKKNFLDYLFTMLK